MFFDVNVFDPKGNLIKTISRKELRKRHWKNFLGMERSKTLIAIVRQDVSDWPEKNPRTAIGISMTVESKT